MLFASTNATHFILVLSLIIISTYAGHKWKSMFATKNDEYAMIRNYLLNDSPLFGFDKPKIWIHSKFEYNARQWKSFYSRSSTDLNQPYIHLTIQSIINHCADDFHICLVDDESFSKLLPSWEIDLSMLAEPMKSRYREIAMAELVYSYGGMVLPNSCVCLQSLKHVYTQAVQNERPFVCETRNKSENIMHNVRHAFMPGTLIYGSPKHSHTMSEFVSYLKEQVHNSHFSSEDEFQGKVSYWCAAKIREGKVNLVSGDVFGLKLACGKPVLLDHLMEEEYLNFSSKCVLVYIPAEELLMRPKFQWMAILPSHELLKTNMVITRYLKASMLDAAQKLDESLMPKPKSVVAL